MRRFLLCVVGVVALTTPGVASREEGAGRAAVFQPPKPTQQPSPKPKPGTPAEETQQVTLAPEPNRRSGQLANVKLDVTIADQRGTGQPTTKTVSLVLADRANGRIRTTGEIPVPITLPGPSPTTQYQMRSIVLNVDAYPELTRDGRVRAYVTLEYRPATTESGPRGTPNDGAGGEQLPPTISESFTVVLDDGKPLVVSQSADPNTDRRVRVEVKATILK